MITKPCVPKGMPPRAFPSSVRLAAGVLLGLMLLVTRLQAFSLMGPFDDWMTPALCYRLPDDVGGPMDINEEYRWNVPIVTYAFDASFVDYFGSNGVAAVEQAFAILNNLPPASSVVLTNYSTESRRMNWRAYTQHLYDLKSATLPLLLEQMGLAEPVRNIYVLRRWDPIFVPTDPFAIWPTWDLDASRPEWGALGLIIQRNFDPDLLLASPVLNGVFFHGFVYPFGSHAPTPFRANVLSWPVDPGYYYTKAVADWKGSGNWRFSGSYDGLEYGVIFTGLTRDDVGGLRYLLNTNNINFETLLPDVHGTGTNADAYVNLALRPGVEKITFRRQDYDALLGQAVPFTYQFTDTYITNGIVMQQQLERVITQPDFLFSATDTGEGSIWTPIYMRSSTSNWWNSAKASGQTNNGPGVIRPPVRINFHKPGPTLYSYEATPEMEVQIEEYKWGSFNEVPTNPPVVYPCSTLPDSETLSLRFRLASQALESTQAANYTWEFPVKTGEQAILQVSSNLVNWVSCAVVTNQGTLIEWQHFYSAHPQKFFRVVPH